MSTLGPDRDAKERNARKRVYFTIRVSILLCVLGAVLFYAWHDVTSRSARRDWTRTLDVAVVVLRLGPVDDDAMRAFKDRASATEDRLASEAARHRGDAMRPFALHVLGPVDVAAPPPLPEGDGIGALLAHAWAMRRYLSDVDDRAGVASAGYDSRVYVAVRAPKSETRQLVEGASEQGGRVGTVSVELNAGMVDFAWFVVVHELFHTLGANDKYDATGRAVVPDGLAEPDRSPRYPQRFAEIMTRNRPLSPTEEAVPDKLDELAVGPTTAREIGWSR